MMGAACASSASACFGPRLGPPAGERDLDGAPWSGFNAEHPEHLWWELETVEPTEQAAYLQFPGPVGMVQVLLLSLSAEGVSLLLPAEVCPWLPTVLVPLAELGAYHQAIDGQHIAAAYFRIAHWGIWVLTASEAAWTEDGRYPCASGPLDSLAVHSHVYAPPGLPLQVNLDRALPLGPSTLSPQQLDEAFQVAFFQGQWSGYSTLQYPRQSQDQKSTQTVRSPSRNAALEEPQLWSAALLARLALVRLEGVVATRQEDSSHLERCRASTITWRSSCVSCAAARNIRIRLSPSRLQCARGASTRRRTIFADEHQGSDDVSLAALAGIAGVPHDGPFGGHPSPRSHRCAQARSQTGLPLHQRGKR